MSHHFSHSRPDSFTVLSNKLIRLKVSFRRNVTLKGYPVHFFFNGSKLLLNIQNSINAEMMQQIEEAGYYLMVVSHNKIQCQIELVLKELVFRLNTAVLLTITTEGKLIGKHTFSTYEQAVAGIEKVKGFYPGSVFEVYKYTPDRFLIPDYRIQS